MTFIDTSILLRAYDLDAPTQRAIARQRVEQAWAATDKAVVSVRVLEELHENLIASGLSPEAATEIVEDYMTWTVVETTVSLIHATWSAQARWHISFRNASILTAARVAGAQVILSEELSPGESYDGIEIVNPFLDSEASTG